MDNVVTSVENSVVSFSDWIFGRPSLNVKQDEEPEVFDVTKLARQKAEDEGVKNQIDNSKITNLSALYLNIRALLVEECKNRFIDEGIFIKCNEMINIIKSSFENSDLIKSCTFVVDGTMKVSDDCRMVYISFAQKLEKEKMTLFIDTCTDLANGKLVIADVNDIELSLNDSSEYEVKLNTTNCSYTQWIPILPFSAKEQAQLLTKRKIKIDADQIIFTNLVKQHIASFKATSSAMCITRMYTQIAWEKLYVTSTTITKSKKDNREKRDNAIFYFVEFNAELFLAIGYCVEYHVEVLSEFFTSLDQNFSHRSYIKFDQKTYTVLLEFIRDNMRLFLSDEIVDDLGVEHHEYTNDEYLQLLLDDSSKSEANGIFIRNADEACFQIKSKNTLSFTVSVTCDVLLTCK